MGHGIHIPSGIRGLEAEGTAKALPPGVRRIQSLEAAPRPGTGPQHRPGTGRSRAVRGVWDAVDGMRIGTVRERRKRSIPAPEPTPAPDHGEGHDRSEPADALAPTVLRNLAETAPPTGHASPESHPPPLVC